MAEPVQAGNRGGTGPRAGRLPGAWELPDRSRRTSRPAYRPEILVQQRLKLGRGFGRQPAADVQRGRSEAGPHPVHPALASRPGDPPPAAGRRGTIRPARRTPVAEDRHSRIPLSFLAVLQRPHTPMPARRARFVSPYASQQSVDFFSPMNRASLVSAPSPHDQTNESLERFRIASDAFMVIMRVRFADLQRTRHTQRVDNGRSTNHRSKVNSGESTEKRWQ